MLDVTFRLLIRVRKDVDNIATSEILNFIEAFMPFT
jgi:hypothetical protein